MTYTEADAHEGSYDIVRFSYTFAGKPDFAMLAERVEQRTMPGTKESALQETERRAWMKLPGVALSNVHWGDNCHTPGADERGDTTRLFENIPEFQRPGECG